MPSIFRVPFEDGDVATWNLEKRVGGFQGVTRGLDVKLVQYLLFLHNRAQQQTGKGVILITGVDGIWGSGSRAALDRFEAENANVLFDDDALDPATSGRFSKVRGVKKKLKIHALQGFYFKAKTGQNDVNVVPAAEMQTVIMGLPDNEPDIPSDLKQKLIQVRDDELV